VIKELYSTIQQGGARTIMRLQAVSLTPTHRARTHSHTHVHTHPRTHERTHARTHTPTRTGDNLARSCDDDRNKLVLEDGEGWNPGNSTPWSCSKSAAGMCNVSWGYFFLSISCQQSTPAAPYPSSPSPLSQESVVPMVDDFTLF
jgi:hypothetical protein